MTKFDRIVKAITTKDPEILQGLIHPDFMLIRENGLVSKDEQLEFLENNAWEPFENYRGKDIHGWIHQLAYDIQNGLFPMKGDAYDQGEEV